MLPVRAVARWAGCALVLAVAAACGARGGPTETASPSTAAGATVTATGLASVDAISADARWLVGTQPREPGTRSPRPLIRLDRQTGEQRVLCDWADERLGYCSFAEQGGMIPESPHLLLELVDDNAVRGWFPSGGVFLLDTATGARTRIDTDSQGSPLQPAWTPAPCGGQCDYHQTPRLHITTDAVSADGTHAAFCANYLAPREPTLYVKDLASGDLTRTTVRCGVSRIGPERDDDEFGDEAMSYPRISADGAVVHVSGDEVTGGEYGRLGWRSDSLYLTESGEVRSVPGSGSMTRDGSTLFLRAGEQAEVPEAQVAVDYVAYDVTSGNVTPLPWMRQFLATATQPAPVLDTSGQASGDGRLVLNDTAVREVGTGAETDVASLLRVRGYTPTAERGPLRISGDGSTILADVVAGDPPAEATTAAVMVTGWGWEPTARATLTPVDEQTALRVDIDPDAVGPWTFEVGSARDTGAAAAQWTALNPAHVTDGAANIQTVDLPTGTYRVRVPAQHGYGEYVSAGQWVAPEPHEKG